MHRLNAEYERGLGLEDRLKCRDVWTDTPKIFDKFVLGSGYERGGVVDSALSVARDRRENRVLLNSARLGNSEMVSHNSLSRLDRTNLGSLSVRTHETHRTVVSR